MNDPAIAATSLMPRASPRWSLGKASVRIAAELAKMKAPPTPWPMRMKISQVAASPPVIQVTREQHREHREDGEAER